LTERPYSTHRFGPYLAFDALGRCVH
jgi:hypothetical protein